MDILFSLFYIFNILSCYAFILSTDNKKEIDVLHWLFVAIYLTINWVFDFELRELEKNNLSYLCTLR